MTAVIQALGWESRSQVLEIVKVAILAVQKEAMWQSVGVDFCKCMTDRMEASMLDLKCRGTPLNVEVCVDPELNPASLLEQGETIWSVRFTDAPSTENPTTRFMVTTKWVVDSAA